MIRKEYHDLSERESSYGKVFKVAGPCILFTSLFLIVFSGRRRKHVRS